jgi:hypothetical protein
MFVDGCLPDPENGYLSHGPIVPADTIRRYQG